MNSVIKYKLDAGKMFDVYVLVKKIDITTALKKNYRSGQHTDNGFLKFKYLNRACLYLKDKLSVLNARNLFLDVIMFPTSVN